MTECRVSKIHLTLILTAILTQASHNRSSITQQRLRPHLSGKQPTHQPTSSHPARKLRPSNHNPLLPPQTPLNYHPKRNRWIEQPARDPEEDPRIHHHGEANAQRRVQQARTGDCHATVAGVDDGGG